MKMCLKKNSIVQYYGENYVTNFDHWTTVENYQDGIHNIRVQIAQTEFFSVGVGTWESVLLDKDDIEIVEQ